MNDRYFTDDMFFASAISYIFGDESLQRIEIPKGRRATFHYAVPSLDAEEYFSEFMNGELAISDLRSLARCYGSLARRLKDINRSGETEWQAPRNEAWWRAARTNMAAGQSGRPFHLSPIPFCWPFCFQPLDGLFQFSFGGCHIGGDVRKVTQVDDAPVAAEILAQTIIDIDAAMKRLSTSGLKRKAIVALVHDTSGIGKRDIEIVLNNLESLRATWLTK